MTAPDIRDAERLFFEGDFDGAFARFRRIAGDDARSLADRSIAFASMASLVVAWPSLHPEDQTGLTFLQRAIELDPANACAWWCVIESFGEHYPSHQDAPLVRRALDWLGRQPLTAADRDRLNEYAARFAGVLPEA
jgi:hypothetical protein